MLVREIIEYVLQVFLYKKMMIGIHRAVSNERREDGAVQYIVADGAGGTRLASRRHSCEELLEIYRSVTFV